MRAALWILALFGIAAAIALLAGNNPGTVTIFWPLGAEPKRIDFSLNLALLGLIGGFLLFYALLRGIAALSYLPNRTRLWRKQQKEQMLATAMLDASMHYNAARFTRSRKCVNTALKQIKYFTKTAQPPAAALQTQVLLHTMAAQNAHALQVFEERDAHIATVLEQTQPSSNSTPASQTMQELRDGALLRAAHWALDDHNPELARDRLSQLSAGATRRTQAMRARLKAARMTGHTTEALDTAHLLAKHGGFAGEAIPSVIRSLTAERLDQAVDQQDLLAQWKSLSASEQKTPEIAIHAARRLAVLGGQSDTVREWLLPVWDQIMQDPDAMVEAQSLRFVRALEYGLQSLDSRWLTRIEQAQQQHPENAVLQYLAGVACLHSQLWGKAQQRLEVATRTLAVAVLRSNAWLHLAELAEQRADSAAASAAWKNAAQELAKV